MSEFSDLMADVLEDIKSVFGETDPMHYSQPGSGEFDLTAVLHTPDPRDEVASIHFAVVFAKLKDFTDAGISPTAGDDLTVNGSTYKVYKVGPPQSDGGIHIYLHAN